MTETEEASPRGVAILSDDADDEGPFLVHGVAIGEEDTTHGRSGKKKRWLPSALEQVAATLEGVPLTTDHSRDPEVVVGEVTDATYEEGTGVVYEAELDDADLAQKVQRGRLEVSPRVFHPHTSDLERADDGAYLIDEVREARHLALVQHGAAPSNSVAAGEASLSAADLREMLGYEEDEADEEEDMSADEQESTDMEIPVLGRDDLRGGASSKGDSVLQNMGEEENEYEDLVDEARELDNPVVVEKSEVEDLREEVQGVKEQYADLVSEASPFTPDELVEKFEVEDLREKHQELVEGEEVEDLTADPRSGDPDGDEEGDSELADLSDEKRQEVADAKERLEYWDGKNETVADAEREKIADLVGADSFDEVDVEAI
jgi:hypothetical protein